jgi:ABC-type multidrug transport system fused ATPase/permease subunit
MHDANKPPEASTPMWKMLAPFLKPHTGSLALAVALNALCGVAISFQTLMPKYLIDDVILARGLSAPQRYIRLGGLVALYLFATLVCRMGAWHWSYRIFTRVREAALFGLRARFFRHINHLCLRFHARTQSGELFNYLFGSPLTQVQQYFHQLSASGPSAMFTLLSSLIWVWGWDWVMAAVLAASVTSTVWMMHRVRQRMEALHRDYQAIEGNVSGQVADLLRGQRDVKLYAMESQVIARFESHAGRVEDKTIQRDIGSHIQWMKAESVSYFFFALLCGASVWCYRHRGVSVGEIQAYLGAFIALQNPLTMLLQISTLRGSAQASLLRLDAVLNTMSTTPDPAESAARVPGRGEIVFREVHFAYEEEPTLCGVNLRIPFGQRIAFVGPSGAGKTTLAQLLLRFYLPGAGEIAMDGCDIRHCRGGDLRRIFGVVPQDPYFFRTTLRDNIRLVLPEADDEALRRVCERANAWEFVQAMPAGLDTSVGEGGSSLSGGQKQRLAIARALLHEPSYFIFDEATSALDTLSERLIQQSLDRVIAGRTAIFIAHRLSTVRTCDRIVVLQKGRIVQDGGYEELVNQPGLFQAMVASDELRG